MKYLHTKKDPQKAYVSNNLLLPKSGVNINQIKTALSFTHGVESIINEFRELEGVQPREIRLWDTTKHHIIVPREFIPAESYHLYKFPFIDLSPTKFPKTKIKDTIKLRDASQEEALKAVLDNKSGTLNLACGKGKTVIGLKLAAVVNVPTLVVVNTTALLEQWKEEIHKHLNIKSIGTVQGEVCDWDHPITVAMVHTLSLKRDEWSMDFRKHFGLVIYDEGHHMSAPIFVKSADLFFGRRISLTATASRLDGLEIVYQHHLGQVIYSDLSQELIPTTVFHRLDWEMKKEDLPSVMDTWGNLHIAKIRAYLGTLDWRNELIYECVLEDLAEGRSILILSHGVSHVKKMQAELSYLGTNAGCITGGTHQLSRLSVLKGTNPVIGTFQLAREGLNKPELDTLYSTTPFSSRNDMQQSWGRIQRIHEGKQRPLVRIFEDLAFEVCERSSKNLRKALKSINYPYSLKRLEIPHGD